MKTFYAALLGLSLALQAQEPFNNPPPTRLSREELKDLTGPIALYPDPLVALILPASTFPGDLVIAARFVDSGDDPSLADTKPWDDSIKGLTRYPDTLKWMDENLEWTTQLGDAYLAQPEDVMDAIQELRAQAQSLGNLQDTPQQLILRNEERIRIVPANPEYIYVPQYVPEVVYYERPVQQPLLTFGLGYLVGSWLRYDFDWHNRRLYCGDYQRHDGDYRHDYDRNDRRGDVRINNYIANYQVWNVDNRRRSAAVNRVAVTVERGVAYRQSHPQSFDERRARPSNGGNDRPDHRDSRFALPKPKSTHAAVAGRESVRRALSPDNDKRGPNDKPRSDGKPDRPKDDKSPATRGPTNGNKDDNRGDGRTMKPKTDAPNTPGDGKRGDNDKPRGDGKPDRPKEDKSPATRGPTNGNKDDNRGDGRTMKPKTDAPNIPGDGKRGDNGKPNNDGKPPATRGPSNDNKDDNRGDGRTMQPKTDAPNAPGDGKRGDNGKPNNDGKPPATRGPSNDKKDDNRGDGRTMKPKTDAPNTPGDGKRGDNGKPQRPNDDKPQANRGQPARPDPRPSALDVKPRSPTESNGGRQADRPTSRGDGMKAPAPERREAPKPKAAAPERREAPKPKAAAPERREAPKPKAAAPERREAPKPKAAAPAPKPAAPAAKPKAPASDKDKKDKDKDKKR